MQRLFANWLCRVALITWTSICVLQVSAAADSQPAPSPAAITPTAAPAPATAPTLGPPPAGPTPAALTGPSPTPAAAVGGGGWRRRLHSEGVDLRADYISESAVNDRCDIEGERQAPVLVLVDRDPNIDDVTINVLETAFVRFLHSEKLGIR